MSPHRLKEDIEIAPEHVNTALHKDTVEVAVGGKNRLTESGHRHQNCFAE